MGTDTAPFDLVGDRRGFRLIGAHYQGGFPVNAFVFCEDDLCTPGARAEFQHAASGLDLPATATLDGITYENVGSLNSRASALIGFSSTFTVPPFSPTATLQMPFVMQGSFSVDGTLLTLSGTGALTTRWFTSGGEDTGDVVWNLLSARYDFSPAAPIPEPSTLLLAGTAGIAAVYRKRRRGSR